MKCKFEEGDLVWHPYGWPVKIVQISSRGTCYRCMEGSDQSQQWMNDENEKKAVKIRDLWEIEEARTNNIEKGRWYYCKIDNEVFKAAEGVLDHLHTYSTLDIELAYKLYTEEKHMKKHIIKAKTLVWHRSNKLMSLFDDFEKPPAYLKACFKEDSNCVAEDTDDFIDVDILWEFANKSGLYVKENLLEKFIKGRVYYRKDKEEDLFFKADGNYPVCSIRYIDLEEVANRYWHPKHYEDKENLPTVETEEVVDMISKENTETFTKAFCRGAGFTAGKHTMEIAGNTLGLLAKGLLSSVGPLLVQAVAEQAAKAAAKQKKGVVIDVD